MTPYFLAIDAGGTKTDILLADNTNELARVRTGSIKLLNTPAEIAEQNLSQALKQVRIDSGVSLAQVTRTCVGASGISVPLVANWIRAQIEACAAGELILCGDEEIALDAAFHGGRGVLVLAGTGSNAIARTASGALVRAGGLGPVLGDEGSGYWIGLHAIRSIFRALERGRSTTLLERILNEWTLAGPSDLIQIANISPPPPFAALTPTVVQCAESGDVVAQFILQEAGQELARLAGLVIDRMHVLEQEADTRPWQLPGVALAGSILQSIPAVRHHMIKELEKLCPGAVLNLDPVDPIQGALWRARAG